MDYAATPYDATEHSAPTRPTRPSKTQAPVKLKLTPTPEQQAILDTTAAMRPGETLVITAYAGTGKTASAEMLIAAHPEWAILYLAYNADIVAEANKKFKKAGHTHATVLTNHGLAWRLLEIQQWIPYKGAPRNLRQWEVQRWLRSQTRLPTLRTIKDTTQAALILKTLRRFFYSADPTPAAKHVPLDCKDRDARAALATHTQHLWAAMQDRDNPTIPLEHDGYLKAFQIQQPTLHFDLIILDEAMDTNYCVMDFINRQNARKILLGDENQMINRYRGATSAMKTPGHRLPLSQSWRFGDAIADVANQVMAFIPDNAPTFLPLRGTPSMQSEIGPIDAPPYTVLCRSNRGVIETAFQAASQGLKINSGAKDLEDGILYVETAHALLTRRRLEKRHPDLVEFRDWQQLSEEAEHDETLRWLKKFCEGHREDMDDLCQTLRDAKTRMKKQADVLVVTAHRSKGLEYQQVKLANDFARLDRVLEEALDALPQFSNPKPGDLQAWRDKISVDELNLLYVAATRAQTRLELNRTFGLLEQLQPLLAPVLGVAQDPQQIVKDAPPPIQDMNAAEPDVPVLTDEFLQKLPPRDPWEFQYATLSVPLKTVLNRVAHYDAWSLGEWLAHLEVIFSSLQTGRISEAEIVVFYEEWLLSPEEENRQAA